MMTHDGNNLDRKHEIVPNGAPADAPGGAGLAARDPAAPEESDPRAMLAGWRAAEAGRGIEVGPPRQVARPAGKGATADEFGAGGGFLRMIGRAFLLRCPRCGGRGILRTWFSLQQRCPTCRLVLNRGESEDYWLGGFTINFVVGETVAVLLVVGLMLATLPNVPWTAITYTAMVACVVVPILFYPFSRTLFLAVDLFARPSQRGDRWGSSDPRGGYGARHRRDRR